MRTVRLELDKLSGMPEVHELFKKVLDTPEYYGSNLDAMYDVLSTYSDPLKIEVVLGEKTDEYANLLSTIEDARNANKRILVVVIAPHPTN